MSPGPEHSVRVRIEGRVQGVWYRGWTVQEANRLGLSGWVRNRLDGTVEAVFSGAPEAVGRMLELCRQGPPAARVDGVYAEPCSAPESGFRPLPTI